MLNLTAMKQIQKCEYSSALDYLRRAETLVGRSPKARATTFNNLACFYRRTNKLRTAHKFLLLALDIETKTCRFDELADTHLNICAVLSQLGSYHSLAVRNFHLARFLCRPSRRSIRTLAVQHCFAIGLTALQLAAIAVDSYHRTNNKHSSQHCNATREIRCPRNSIP